MRASIRLCIGSPDTIAPGARPEKARFKPVSTTRFVLPFGYALRRLGKDEEAISGPWFREKPPDDDCGPAKDASPAKRGKEGSEAKLIERLLAAESAARAAYLTNETKETLLQRACWFEVDGEFAWSGTIPSMDSGGSAAALKVGFSRPRLVLFEWPNGSASSVRNGAGQSPLQTGFLILEAWFDADNPAVTLDDLLDFNEVFRYWREPFDGHFTDHCRPRLGGVRTRPSGNLLEKADREDAYTGRWIWWLKRPIRDKDGESWAIDADTSVHADDRTFVWTCALMEEPGALRALLDWKLGAAALRDAWARLVRKERDECAGLDAHLHGHWIKLLNVDRTGDSPWLTRTFERQWARERTYHRWEECGSYYGFTFHSGALLASPLTDLPIERHFGGQYLDQALLLLYLRVALFRFSRALTDKSAKALDSPEDRRRWAHDFQRLRWQFSLFTNLYRFPLISNQQQGVELFALLKKAMDVEELFEEIKDEVRGSHDYLSIEANERQNETTTYLTVGGAVAAAIGLTLTYLQVSPSPSPPRWPDLLWRTGAFLLGGVAMAFAWGFLTKIVESVRRWPAWVRSLVAGVVIVVLVLLALFWQEIGLPPAN